MKKIPEVLRKLILSVFLAAVSPLMMHAQVEGLMIGIGTVISGDSGSNYGETPIDIHGAESEAAKALQAEIAAKEKLESLEKKLKTATGDTSKLEKQIKAAKIDLIEKQDARIRAANKLIDAYKALGDRYERAGLVGDPVQIATGEYLYSKNDFIAEDFLDNFSTKRNYRFGRTAESFGKNWTCSLDSRIIRGKHPNVEQSIETVKKEKQLLEEYKNQFNKFFSTTGHYPENYEDECIYIEERESELNNILLEFEQLQEENKSIDELNKYVCYGFYEKNENLGIGTDSLIFIDEDGNSIICSSSDSKNWVPVNPIKAKNFYIVSNDDLSFIVIFKNGEIRNFDKYGILSKISDRCGNCINFKSKNGFVNRIENKTGEILTVTRNEKNQITKISGNTSGNAQFMYSNDNLVYTCNNSDKAESYSYTSDGNLSFITKGFDSGIKIEYEYYKKDGKKRVACVTDEAGNKEFFEYDLSKNIVNHITTAGIKETYELDNDGATLFYENESGNIRRFTFDENKQISGIMENNEWKFFSYDDSFQPVEIRFEDGSVTKTEYNNFGQITFQSDKDGFTNQFIYDKKGNLIEIKYCDVTVSKLDYFPNGLVKSVEENGCTYLYEYNDFGSVTKKTEINSANQSFSESYEYNSSNKLIKYINYKNQILTIEYGDNTKTETTKDKQVIHRYNNKDQEIETIEKDLITGKCFSKTTVYDKGGKPVTVLLNGKKYLSYEYGKPQLMTSCTIWDLNDETSGVRREYAFDSKNRLLSESGCYVKNGVCLDRRVLYQAGYEELSDGFIMKVKKGNLNEHKYFYNNKNQLVKIQRPDGSTEKRTYTKGGKIDSIVKKGTRTDFSYHNNGNISIEIRNKDFSQSNLIYNENGNLIYREDFDGSVFSAGYDNKGRCIREEGPGYYVLYEYDFDNRKVSERVFSKNSELCYESIYKYDDENRCVEKIEGNKYVSRNYFDCWGNLIKSENEKGTSFFTRDIFGNCISETDGNGISKSYNYDCLGNLKESFVNQEIVEKNEWTLDGKLLTSTEFGLLKMECSYDESGNCTSITDDFGNIRNFGFEYDGSIKSVKSYESGKTSMIFDYEEKSLLLKNSDGNSYKEFYDETDNLVKEINSFGDSAEYSYDNNNRISWKKDFEGNNYNFYYDISSNSIVQSFNGTEEYEIKKNPMGKIVSLRSPEENFYYVYDTGAKLIEAGEKNSGIQVFYDYDSMGRCIRKRGKLFDIEYLYDSKGKLSEIKEHQDNSSISLSYDVFGRETKREFSNGVQVFSEYNANGQKIAAYSKEPYGLLISGDFTLYDEKGRKVLNSGKDGEITKYSYDSDGRLISTEYPYNTQILKNAKREAVECGIFINEEKPKGSTLSITYDEYSAISGLLKKAGSSVSINKNQYCWKEKYTYTSTGSIKSIENPFGKIIYEYDSENRLIQKHGEQTVSGGTKYSWSKNGNLTQVINPYQHMKLKYGCFNRPVSILQEDYETGDVEFAEYTYDALGRRTSESVQGKEKHFFLYDGFSNDILIDSPVYQNQSAVINYGVQNSGKAIDQNYRTINPMEYEKFNEFRTKTATSKSTNEIESTELVFESRPCISIMANGIPGAYLYFDSNSYSGKETEFVVMNSSQTSVNAVIDRYGNCIEINNYDTWGNPCSDKNVSSKYISISNSKNTLRINNCIYDLGQRDYIPSMKSFISKDPAKDGFNWYAYCSCDPVNFSDYTGLEKSCLTPYQQARYIEGVVSHLLFDETVYHGIGESAGIHHTYDCADVSGAVDANASTYAGISGYSKMADAFRKNHNNEEYSKARTKINSWSFFTGNVDENVTQTSTGFNRNEYRKGNGQVEERKQTFQNLQDPGIITPGTVLVWRNPEHVDGKNWIGHTLTVLCRNFDSEGNVIGFAYIEGHTSGDKTSLGYMGTNSTYIPGVYTVDNFIGEFLGTFEIESRNAFICE